MYYSTVLISSKMTLEYKNSTIPYDSTFKLILMFKHGPSPPLPPLCWALWPRRSGPFLGRADRTGDRLAGFRVQRESVVTGRRCRARCARLAEQRDRQERSSWARSEEWDCGDGAGGTRNAPTAGAHYVGAARTRGHATRLQGRKD